MRIAFFRMAILAVVLVWGIPATGHHSQALYFDTNKVITLEGEILRVEFVNPHILLFMQSKNERGELEAWILQGSSLNNALRVPGLKDRLQPGLSISARVNPPHNSLFLNDALTVLLTRADDTRKSSRIVAGGQIRLPNGDVLTFGGGPKF